MSKRRSRKHKEEEEVSEAWLLPYSDLLTLLLALFIVLFASSSVDAQKFDQMSRVFNGIFMGGTGPLDYQNPIDVNTDHSSDYPPKSSPVLEEDDNQEKTENQKELTMELEDKKELQEIQSKINAFIEKKEFDSKFSTELTDEGLLLTIRDNVLFESGKAEVRAKDRDTARELAKFLEMEPPRNIIISGHTDNVPIRNAHYGSNWELSVMRAVNFMKVLLEEDTNLDPKWFSAKGFGEFQPIGDNQTAEGRAKNRRVEVLILPRAEATE
ncbi:flagellar motor protein MotB [Bacillus niameyensis]|uniref:flagellar motor protein MotB n=1 Tax=Bacillus niameyensis TaxID=1522308 RepID=UPI000784727B|nr:flagellar motor protein MotB [Bacillus niameyensis]